MIIESLWSNSGRCPHIYGRIKLEAKFDVISNSVLPIQANTSIGTSVLQSTNFELRFLRPDSTSGLAVFQL
jgi:hypothetical protein